MGRLSSTLKQTPRGVEDVYWRATLARDAAADRIFVYAVRSTRIYCRPSCSSRKPRRQNVLFFPAPEAAERAGFRPCQRCRPDEAARTDIRLDVIRRACRYLDEQREDRLSLADLGKHVDVPPHQLLRWFKQIVGITPREYTEARRIDRLKERLREGGSVTRALYDVGYGSSSRLYERAQDRLGMTPATYRRGGHGMRIEYAIANSAFGRLLVAATPRGVCAVYFGSSDRALEATLRNEYPSAEIHRGQDGGARWIGDIVRHLEGKQRDLDLPTDVKATAFQQRVWQQLQAIPYGETRTYREIAERIGAPGAARAVGRACATNPVSVVVPCHRAIKQDGGLGGYRWGIARKERLLAHERGMAGRADTSPPLTSR
jgi:AraC family transcriptional regulator, regulatory protein of adaptative response / methylated-DNA-[protein]-cysteine methyltransferase